MRRLKQILITLCVAVSGCALTGAVSALEWQDEVDVQFIFGDTLTMAITGGYENTGDAIIGSLTPGTADRSDDLSIAVSTNNGSGYVLSARVGVDDGVHNSNSLVGTSGVFTSLASNASYTLTSNDFVADYWGYTLETGNDATFSGLNYDTDKVLRTTTGTSGTGNTGPTIFAIGAKASIGKATGTYSNTVTFTAVANMVAHTVTTVAGANAESAIIGTTGNVTTGSYIFEDQINITATCVTPGYVFGGWMRSGDYGEFGNANQAFTTYTVGNADVTLTAYCVAE